MSEINNNNNIYEIQNTGQEDFQEFFEGTEKLLKIWFTPKSSTENSNSLRLIPK